MNDEQWTKPLNDEAVCTSYCCDNDDDDDDNLGCQRDRSSLRGVFQYRVETSDHSLSALNRSKDRRRRYDNEHEMYVAYNLISRPITIRFSLHASRRGNMRTKQFIRPKLLYDQ